MTIGERLAAHGLALPPGHTLISIGERPDLERPAGMLNGSVWPEFMFHDGVVQANWHHLFEEFSDTQCCLFDADGTFSGYVGACIDITANKTLTLELERAQAAQIAQTMRLQTILATISDGLHIVNARGRLLECNVSFARMLGYTPEEAAHLRVADWEAEIPAAAQPARLAALLAQPARFETRHRRKDGAVIDVEISTNSLELAGERCLLAAARDITER